MSAKFRVRNILCCLWCPPQVCRACFEDTTLKTWSRPDALLFSLNAELGVSYQQRTSSSWNCMWSVLLHGDAGGRQANSHSSLGSGHCVGLWNWRLNFRGGVQRVGFRVVVVVKLSRESKSMVPSSLSHPWAGHGPLTSHASATTHYGIDNTTTADWVASASGTVGLVITLCGSCKLNESWNHIVWYLQAQRRSYAAIEPNPIGKAYVQTLLPLRTSHHQWCSIGSSGKRGSGLLSTHDLRGGLIKSLNRNVPYTSSAKPRTWSHLNVSHPRPSDTTQMKSVRQVSMVERDVAETVRVTERPKKLKPLRRIS
jgi:hypothetical protein